MKDKYFLDTNILIYTFDFSSPEKQACARSLVSNAIEHNQGMVSFQVVQSMR
jgi:predicted nucleic acid-binding protein